MSDTTLEAPSKTELDQASASTNYLVDVIGRITQHKGFREDWELADRLTQLANELDADGVAFSEGDEADMLNKAAIALRNNVIGTKLMLVVSELSEALESLRDTGYDKILAAGNFIEELADAEIRIKDLSQMVGGDLGAEEVSKVVRNAERAYKHGRTL